MEDKAMQNFEFYAPTRMIFGKDTHKQVGKLVKEYGFKKVFVHYGGRAYDAIKRIVDTLNQ